MTSAERDQQASAAKTSTFVIVRWQISMNTADIADRAGMTEPEVCRVLHAWLDLRYHAKRGQIGASTK